MSSLKSISISKLTFIIPFLLGVSFIYSIIFGIIISSHSESYVQGYEIRTAGYPMIINVFSKIFKENGSGVTTLENAVQRLEKRMIRSDEGYEKCKKNHSQI